MPGVIILHGVVYAEVFWKKSLERTVTQIAGSYRDVSTGKEKEKLHELGAP